MNDFDVAGQIHSYESFGTLDGPGIRFVVFLQGCPLRCRYCHNPDTWDPHGGSRKSVREIVDMICSCREFLKNGGVTLSGGEPLFQPEFTLALSKECKRAGFHVALDTAGSMPLEVSRPILDAADLILLDIKSPDQQLCSRLTGKDNTLTLKTLEYCESAGKKVWIRYVLVPGWTMLQEQIDSLAKHLQPLDCIERLELLPYHKMGSKKWEMLGMKDPFADLDPPAPGEVEQIRQYLISQLPGICIL